MFVWHTIILYMLLHCPIHPYASVVNCAVKMNSLQQSKEITHSNNMSQKFHPEQQNGHKSCILRAPHILFLPDKEGKSLDLAIYIKLSFSLASCSVLFSGPPSNACFTTPSIIRQSEDY